MRALAVHGLGGGFAYGVREAGWDLAGQVETRFGQMIRDLNIDPSTLINWDAVNLDRASLRHAMADLLFGCPPCAGFSVAGAGLEQHDNPAHPINNGIRDWFYAVEKAQPTIAVLESVPRTFHSEAGQALWRPLADAHLQGYGITLVTYDNQSFGVPQKRVRTMLWASKRGAPRLSIDWDRRLNQPECLVTSWHLEGLGEPATSWTIEQGDHWGHTSRPVTFGLTDWTMSQVPWGGNARKESENLEIFNRLEAAGRRKPSFLWRRLHPHRPAPVLVADSAERIAHYQGPEAGAGDQLRYISGRELARLMGYPDGFRLTGHLRRDVGPALCQAVSPKAGYWVGNEAARLLEETEPPLAPVGSIAYQDLTALNGT